ncbi:hypothetical protein Bca52824_053012 [Brassica carinata]|uniref:Uncharacterized protein n=1 Tax=Brassica carinata TaxID=52824 RepID=A0A8X7UK71_BRACI|nr:hypothetical protein Bca52824_053012 [Brassica carinata]
MVEPCETHTLLEINGVRTSIYSQGVSSQLRRDRVDKISEAATFISTDNIRLSGSVKFEVCDRDELVLSGTLEMSGKRWGMNCEADVTAGCGFLKDKDIGCSELSSPLPSVEKGSSSELDFEVTEYGRYKEDYEGEYDDDMYMRESTEMVKMERYRGSMQVLELVWE